MSAMPNPVATFKTSVGEFAAEIFLDRVPITASNFIDLCQTGSNCPFSSCSWDAYLAHLLRA
jgi:hypothetical protein